MRQQGYLRASEVARVLHVHHSAVYRLIDTKKLIELRVGGSRYVEIASLREYLGDSAHAFDLPEEE